MTGEEILREAEHLQAMAERYPNPDTKAVLLRASALLFGHMALALESEAASLPEVQKP